MPSKKSPGYTSRLDKIVDHRESYGRHLVKRISRKISPKSCLDIGAGDGIDLSIVKENSQDCELNGLDFRLDNQNLIDLGVNTFQIDIEKDELPFLDNSFDLIIANQVMEHVKEIYWINHQIFKKLKIGGYFFMGVPNLLALHNRILPLFGEHPSCIKMISAHIRGYSIKDTLLYYNIIGKDFLEIEKIYGSQFYPLPKRMSRIANFLFPSLSTSIFFLIRKKGFYDKQFISWIENNTLATSFYKG
tara:strand:+ start:430 stop:1167 length:738 start_codon:yes stop_codon:yes gene_type:complete